MITTPDVRTVIALIGAALTAADGVSGAPHWIGILTAVVTAAMVHLNAPSSPSAPAAAAAAARNVSPAHPAVIAAAAALLGRLPTAADYVATFACGHTAAAHSAADVGDCIRLGLAVPSSSTTAAPSSPTSTTAAAADVDEHQGAAAAPSS